MEAAFTDRRDDHRFADTLVVRRQRQGAKENHVLGQKRMRCLSVMGTQPVLRLMYSSGLKSFRLTLFGILLPACHLVFPLDQKQDLTVKMDGGAVPDGPVDGRSLEQMLDQAIFDIESAADQNGPTKDQAIFDIKYAGDQNTSNDLPQLDLNTPDQATTPDQASPTCPNSVVLSNGSTCGGGRTPIGGGSTCTDGEVLTGTYPTTTGWAGSCTSGAATNKVICAQNAPAYKSKTEIGQSVTVSCASGEKAISGGCKCNSAIGIVLASYGGPTLGGWACNCKSVHSHTAYVFCISKTCSTTDVEVTSNLTLFPGALVNTTCTNGYSLVGGGGELTSSGAGLTYIAAQATSFAVKAALSANSGSVKSKAICLKQP